MAFFSTNNLLSIVLLCSIFVSTQAALINVAKGPVSFYFVDCSYECHELVETRNENKGAGSYSVDLPSKAKLSIVVMCLSHSTDCKLSYTTSAWNQDVVCKANSISTYPASNRDEGLIAEYSTSSYNGNLIRMTLTFKTTLGAFANTQLSEGSILIKDGSIVDGTLTKINDYSYSFEIKPTVNKSNCAVLLNREILSEDGLPLVRGLIHPITYDPVAPNLMNTDYANSLTVDTKEKHYTLSFDKDITSFTISSQVNLFSLDVKTENNRDFTIDAVMKDMVTEATVIINFYDDAKNAFVHNTKLIYNPNADLHLLASLPNGSVKATIPRNPRIELVFDQAVSIQENHFILLQNGEKTDYIDPKNSLRVAVSSTNANIVFLYLNGLLPEKTAKITIPAGLFYSPLNTHANEEIVLEYQVSDVLCGTQYVTSGMKANDLCKCFSIHNQCQCLCGSTYFVRDL